MRDVTGLVRRALDACSVADGSSMLVGISGGPDSTALLIALASLKADLRLTLNACIVDHGIRPASQVEGDRGFVQSLCGALGIPLSVAVVPAGRIRERAGRESRSLEDVAREERHRLLRDMARHLGASWIALGHTQDDNLETIVMRFLQGSEAGALRIPMVRGALIRPLLNCSRREVIDFLRSREQRWREDPSNSDTSILRNRVRHTLIPVLEREFPGARAGMLAFSRKSALAAEALDEEASRMAWEATPRGFSIPVERFFAFPPAVRARQLMRMYDELRGPSSPRRLPWRFLLPALRDEWGPRSRSATIARGHGVELVLRGEKVLWERHIVTPEEKSYFIEVSETGSVALPGIGVRLSFARCRRAGIPAAGQVEVLARDVSWPLVLRSRRRGDEILLERGATPLKELYAGWRVLEGQRQQIPVLADRKGVLLVLGNVLGYPDRTRTEAAVPPGGDADCILVKTDREQEGT